MCLAFTHCFAHLYASLPLLTKRRDLQTDIWLCTVDVRTSRSRRLSRARGFIFNCLTFVPVVAKGTHIQMLNKQLIDLHVKERKREKKIALKTVAGVRPKYFG